jgi:hypothetical protein
VRVIRHQERSPFRLQSMITSHVVEVVPWNGNPS